MTDPAAITGTFADFKTIKTRSTAQLIIEIPIEDADRALLALGGVPQPGKEQNVAVARLQAPEEPVKERKDWNTLGRAAQAGILCSDERFWKYLSATFDYR